MSLESSEQRRIRIEAATPEDIDAVFELRLRARQTDPGLFPTSYEQELAKTPEEKQEWYADTLGEKPLHIIVLAKDGDRPVGMVGARDKGEGLWYLHGVYTVPELRRLGIGEDMMRAIIARIRQYPQAKAITFQAEAENAPALEMYKKYGFEVVGSDTATLGDGKEHEKVVFRQELDKISL